MRILDEESGKTIESVLIMLTPSEEQELIDKLSSIKPENGDHIHISDNNFRNSITLLVYTKDNLKFYSAQLRKIIEDQIS